jgi:hypothetical protein
LLRRAESEVIEDLLEGRPTRGTAALLGWFLFDLAVPEARVRTRLGT